MQNVRFATSGLLEVTGEVKGAVRLPLVLVDAKDAANLSKWKLKINGEINTRYTISVSDEGVTILPPGSMIIIR